MEDWPDPGPTRGASVTDRRARRTRALPLAWYLTVSALLPSGCAVAPHQPVPSVAPVAVPASSAAPGPPSVDRGQIVDESNAFHKTATDRQRFQVHLDFGKVFEAQGNFEGAVLEYQDALAVVEDKRRGPFKPADKALAYRRMAAALDRLGRFPIAEEHYKKALHLCPKDPRIWNDAGYSYYLQGRWSEAERALRRAVELAPEDQRSRTNLGLALAAMGRSQEALSILSRPEGEAIGHANLAYLLAAIGQAELARQHYRQALAMRPDLTVVRRALAQLDRQQETAPQSPTRPESMVQATDTSATSVDRGPNQASVTPATASAPAATLGATTPLEVPAPAAIFGEMITVDMPAPVAIAGTMARASTPSPATTAATVPSRAAGNAGLQRTTGSPQLPSRAVPRAGTADLVDPQVTQARGLR
jgi:Flp pilus assembly protein TadD